MEAILVNIRRAARLLKPGPRRAEPCDLRDLVAQASQLAPAGRRGDLQVAPEANEPLLGRWDGGRVLQVLTNLLDNAAKYSPAGVPIEVEVRRVGGGARIAVHDRGIGVEAGALGQIFDGHRTAAARRLAAGSGIGLRLSRRLIAAEGGRLWAAARPGGGSSFIVELPLATAEHEAGGSCRHDETPDTARQVAATRRRGSDAPV